MTEQEEYYVFFTECVTSLNNSWVWLNKINEELKNPLVGPAFRFALIEYCKPYINSMGVIRRRNALDKKYIPDIYLKLHERILNSRNQVHAHSDITVKEANLHHHESEGKKYSQISQNYISGLEELSNIQEIIKMIEGTLDNMYIEQEKLEQAF